MITNDWVAEAARAIADETSNLDTGDVRRIIREHIPFEEGVAYMPVPRCETCKHFLPWSRPGAKSPLVDTPGIGDCQRFLGRLNAITKDFGCVKWEAK